MATTTNYGWTTPDDTALVKDGASAIRSLGTSIDTTTKNLNPSTTLGDLEYRSSTSNTNTRIPIGTSGQGLQVVAGVPAWAASSTSTLTTTGDLLYASAANTLARRAIGSTGDVLTVSGGLPTWAAPASGSLTLLSTTTLSGTSTTISSISSAYTHLQVVVYGVNINTGTSSFRVAINGATNIVSVKRDNQATARDTLTNSYLTLNNSGSTITNGRTDNAWVFTIHNYTSAFYKLLNGSGIYMDTALSANLWANHFGGGISTTSAISSLVFDNNNGYTFAAGTVLVYGVK